MKRTTINGLIVGLFAGLLAGCGGTSDSSSGTKLLASEAACNSPWLSNVAYTGGQTVSYNGKNYTAAYWTQGQNPSTNNGPAGSGQPWLPGVSCNSDPGVTPTPTPPPAPTPSPACTPTAITPYLQVNGGALQQASSKVVNVGDTVKFSPQPSTGGSWSWDGGCGTNGTAREQTVSGGTCSAITTYTNSCGARSSQTFVLTLSDVPPTPPPVPTPAPTIAPTPAPTPTPTDSCPPYVQGHSYATGVEVTNIGKNYQCTVSGWCSLNSDAYSPGTGWAWQQAWTQTTITCGNGPVPTPAPAP